MSAATNNSGSHAGTASQHHGTHLGGVSLRDVAAEFGTPCFVYSADAIRDAWRALDHAFASVPHRLCYAVKANSNLAVLSLLNELGAGFDIVSGGELARVLRVGADPQSVVFAGVGKTAQEMDAALDAGVGCFNIESAAELRLLAQRARTARITARVALRLNPNVDARTHPYISTGLRENKFGIPIEDAVDLYREAAALEFVEVRGVGAHIGSQIDSAAPFVESLEALIDVVDALENEGIAIEELDLGGGIGVRYNDEATPDLSQYAGAVAQRLGGRNLPIVLEPGRSIVANAGVLLTRTEFLKRNGERNFAVVDAAMNDLIRPALYSANHPVWAVAGDEQEPAEPRTWDVVGPVCESGDWLARQRNLTLARGSLLAIGGAGAYSAVMSSNYNSRPRAPEVMIDAGTAHLIRRRETIEDLLRTELEAMEANPASGA